MAFDLLFGQNNDDWSRGSSQTVTVGGEPTRTRKTVPMVATIGVLVGGFFAARKLKRASSPLSSLAYRGDGATTLRLPAHESMQNVVEQRLR